VGSLTRWTPAGADSARRFIEIGAADYWPTRIHPGVLDCCGAHWTVAGRAFYKINGLRGLSVDSCGHTNRDS